MLLATSAVRSPTLRIRIVHWALGAIGVTVANVWVAAPLWASTPLLAAANVAVSLAFAATAAVLWNDPGQRGNAALFWTITVLFTAGLLGTRSIGPLPLLEFLLGPLGFVALAVVLLRYPEPRLQRSRERVFVGVAIAATTTLRLATAALSEPEWERFGRSAWWPTVTANARGAAIASTAYAVSGLLLVAVFVPLLVARIRRTRGIDRLVFQPVMLSALAFGLSIACETASRLLPDENVLRDPLIIAECAAALLVPTAFLVAAVRRQLSHAAVGTLVRTLSRPVTIDLIRSALRDSLADPRLEVAYWLPEQASWFDTQGRPFDGAALPPERFVAHVAGGDGEPLAVVTLDRSMRRYPDLLDSALAAAALALENGRLQAEMRARLAEVKESRARLVGAADTARRRIERDLHDGAQQRLLALKLALAVARSDAASPAELQLIDRTRSELQEALDDLRRLARGIHPALLVRSGLGPAVRSVAERLPLAVEVDIPPHRWDPEVEATAYFVVCEALANTVKHAGAEHAVVSVAEKGPRLVLEVADDGAGGAEEAAGGGLAGLRDRVAAAGGSLTVISPAGAGTHLIVSLRCG